MRQGQQYIQIILILSNIFIKSKHHYKKFEGDFIWDITYTYMLNAKISVDELREIDKNLEYVKKLLRSNRYSHME